MGFLRVLWLLFKLAVFQAMRFLRVLWRLFKLAVFGAVLFGAFCSCATTGALTGLVASAQTADLGPLFGWVADSWLPLSIGYIAWNSYRSKVAALEHENTESYTRLFIGTILNYFEVVPRVRTQDEVREKGWWRTLLGAQFERLVGYGLLGLKPTDERLNARPVRGFSFEDATFDRDLRAALHAHVQGAAFYGADPVKPSDSSQ